MHEENYESTTSGTLHKWAMYAVSVLRIAQINFSLKFLNVLVHIDSKSVVQIVSAKVALKWDK